MSAKLKVDDEVVHHLYGDGRIERVNGDCYKVLFESGLSSTFYRKNGICDKYYCNNAGCFVSSEEWSKKDKARAKKLASSYKKKSKEWF
jgi:hypothetical protein